MITITLSTAILLYSGFILIGFAALWLFTELSAVRTQRLLEKQHLWRCAYCGYVYLDETAELLSHCPRCASFNAAAEAQDRAVKQEKERFVEAHAPADTETPDADLPRRNPSHRKRTRGASRGPRRRR